MHAIEAARAKRLRRNQRVAIAVSGLAMAAGIVILPVPGPLHVLLLSSPLGRESTGRAGDLEAAERAGIRTRPLDAKVR